MVNILPGVTADCIDTKPEAAACVVVGCMAQCQQCSGVVGGGGGVWVGDVCGW